MRQVTVTLTRYAEPDSLLSEVLDHATAQQGVEGEVLLIEQKPESTIREKDYAAASLPLRIVRAKLGGLSEARNLSIAEAAHDTILFLDADAIAAPDWARELAGALADPAVAIAGCRIVPRWSGREPLIARARVARDQYSLLDLGSGKFPYPRVVGAGFGIDRAKTGTIRFDPNLGRREGKLFSGEESEFCDRALQAGLGIAYCGSAVIEHVIAPERMRIGWITRRLLYAGQSRGKLGGTPSPSRPPGPFDWLTLPVTLPPYALGWLWGKVGG